MSTLATALLLLMPAQAIPVPDATVTLGEPPRFKAALGAEDLAFSPDGQRLAALVRVRDGTRRVNVYALSTGKVLRRFGRVPGKTAARIAWAPRAQRVVTATDGVMHLWDLASGEKLKHINLGPAFRVEVDRLLVSDRAEFAVYVPRRGGSSATVDLAADELTVEAIPYRKELQGFDAMARLLVTDQGAARLIDPLTSRPLQACATANTTGHAEPHSGKQLWLRGEVWTRQLNNLARCKPSRWQPLRPGATWRQAVFGARGGVVAAANERSIAVWDRNGALLYRYEHHTPMLRSINRLHVSPDGAHVAFPGRRLRVLRLADKRWLSLPNDVDDPAQVAMSGDGALIAVADVMLGTRVFARATGSLVAALGQSQRVVLDATGRSALLLGRKRVSMIDVMTAQVQWDMPTSATQLAISRDRSTIAIAGPLHGRPGVQVFEWTRTRPAIRQHMLADDNGWTSSLALNRNGSQVLVTTGRSHNLHVMDVGSARLEPVHRHSFKSRGGLSRGLFLPGDQGVLTTPAFRKRVDVTRSSTGRSRALTRGAHHTSAVHALPGGKRVVLANEAGRMGIWDLAEKKRLVSWQAHAATVRSIAASSDGRWLVSTGKGGRVKVWPIGGQISATSTAQR